MVRPLPQVPPEAIAANPAASDTATGSPASSFADTATGRMIIVAVRTIAARMRINVFFI